MILTWLVSLVRSVSGFDAHSSLLFLLLRAVQVLKVWLTFSISFFITQLLSHFCICPFVCVLLTLICVQLVYAITHNNPQAFFMNFNINCCFLKSWILDFCGDIFSTISIQVPRTFQAPEIIFIFFPQFIFSFKDPWFVDSNTFAETKHRFIVSDNEMSLLPVSAARRKENMRQPVWGCNVFILCIYICLLEDWQCLFLQKTSVLCALERKVLATRAPRFTASSLNSCARYSYEIIAVVFFIFTSSDRILAELWRLCFTGWRLYQPQWNWRQIHLRREVCWWELPVETHRHRDSVDG